MSFWFRLRKWLGLKPRPASFSLEAWQAQGLRYLEEIQPGWAQLTPREQQIAWLMAQGCTNRQIAERLFISRETAKSHVSRVLHKLELHSRYELRQFFDAEGVLDSAAPPGDEPF